MDALHRRVTRYIDTLPAGLASYPTCAQKGSIPRMWTTGSPALVHGDTLPQALRTLIESPPVPSSWVAEVQANALYLAICDEHFANDDAFVEHSYQLNVRLFRTPLYRALTVLASPASFVKAVQLGWKLLRRGTSLTVVSTSAQSIRLRLASPPGVTPEVIARCYGTGFEVRSRRREPWLGPTSS